MAGFGAEPRMPLKKFVFMYPLPQCAKVIEGYQDPDNDDHEFSANDLVEIRGVACPYVDLTFCRPSSSGGDVRVRLPTDINTLRFRLSNSDRKTRVFHGVQELIDKRPQSVRAIGVSASRTLPTAMLKGEALRIVGVEPPQAGCQPSMLELKTSTMQIVRLPLSYTGNFEEVVDSKRLYTLEELAWLGSVPRTLTLDVSNRDPGVALPVSIPTDFRGDIHMAAPQLFVDVSIKNTKCSSSDDDDDDDDDDDENTSSEDDEEDSFLVPIDSEISVSPRPEDYECLIDEQFPLQNLPINHLSSTANVFRVVSWQEETSVLHYHSIRPGDRLAFHSKHAVRKLSARMDDRFFFIPISHKGQFTFLDGASKNLPVMLSELSADSTFPFRMQYKKCAGVSADPGLPCGVPLSAEGLISEDAVLATKVYELKTFQTFFLPLRTRIIVGVETDTRNEKKRTVLMSDASSYVEEVSEDVFNNRDICSRVVADERPPPIMPRRAKYHAAEFTSGSTAAEQSTPVTSSTSVSSSSTATAVKKVGSLQLDQGNEPAKPPITRRNPTHKQPGAPVATTRTSPSQSHPPRPAAQPPPTPDRQTTALPPTSPTSPLLTDDADKSETVAGDGNKDSVYSYASEDIMWRQIGLSLFNKAQQCNIPADCDVSGYTTEQLLPVMRLLNVPQKVLLHWYRLGVDGQTFSMMSDDDLRLFDLDQPLVRQLHACSQRSLLASSPDALAGLNDAYVQLRPKRDL